MGKLGRNLVLGAGGLVLAASLATAAQAADGKALYDSKCKSCHGDNGAGNEKMKTKNLAQALKGKSDADITKVVKEGGKAVGMSPMMPAVKLSDDELKAVVEYTKGLAK